MSRSPLSSLDAAIFDVAVIGAGINGASTAQELAAAGYSVLLLDKGDFGAGTSSRSSRLMQFGIRYLDRGEPLLNYFLHPGWFIKQCGRARDTMRHRAELVATMPERMKRYTLCIPVYRQDHFAPWQMAAALRLISALGGGALPVRWRRLPRADFGQTPLVRDARNPEDLRAVFAMEEYQFDWPERLVMDYVMDAARLGATCRNYCPVIAMERAGDQAWRLTLQEAQDDNDRAEVVVKQVVNCGGPWIDRILARAEGRPRQQVAPTKGSHIALRLPPAYRGLAFAHFNSLGYPFYILPWRDDLHYIGPTETAYDGDPDSVRVTAEEIDFLLREANRMLPGLALERKQILFHWAGVRPMPFVPGYKGKQNLVPAFNDHDAEGLPGVLSIPGGPLMLHRFTGRRAAKALAEKLAPSGKSQHPSYASRAPAEETNSPPVNTAHPNLRFAHLKEMAREEMVTGLQDLLLRRAGLGWLEGHSKDVARDAARAVADDLGWDEDAITREVEAYVTFVNEHFQQWIEE